MTHICVGKLTIIGSDNGLSPGRRQAIIWTNAGILWIGPLETNFSEILIGIQTLSLKKMHLKMASAKWRPFFLGLNVLSQYRCDLINPYIMWHSVFTVTVVSSLLNGSEPFHHKSTWCSFRVPTQQVQKNFKLFPNPNKKCPYHSPTEFYVPPSHVHVIVLSL